mmetsp:Transcript_2063/g.4133  ORF Transcript_2063/g.4133 Transcript_2063/m.4133 type:complete len:147 (-) Transcript_2063:2554-2994(-)
MQLRTEYERVFEKLNAEKRELIIKNSSAYSDIQKSEHHAWKMEEELNTVKEQNVSLQLSLERMQQLTALNHLKDSLGSYDASAARSKGSNVSKKASTEKENYAPVASNSSNSKMKDFYKKQDLEQVAGADEMECPYSSEAVPSEKK